MIRQTRLKTALAALLIATAASAGAQTKPDPLAGLKVQADSIMAAIGRVILNQDSTLLQSIISDTVGVVMPGSKSTSGRERVARYTPLLFQTVGGAKLETTRVGIGKVPEHENMAREAGRYSLSRNDSSTGKLEKWQGQYSVYWRFTDTTWVIERLFVSGR